MPNVTSVRRPPVANYPKISSKGDHLIAKLQTLLRNEKKGSFSISFQNVKGGNWLSSVAGVGAVDKLERGAEGGRKVKAFVMVRVASRGGKYSDILTTKRVPAYGVKPVVVDSLADIAKLAKEGPAKARAAWKTRAHG